MIKRLHKTNYFLCFILFLLFLFTSCTKKKIVDSNNDEPPGSAPATPSIPRIELISQEPNRGMYLIIYDASDNEEGFVIERKTFGGTFSPLTNLPANTETYDDWGVEMSTSYTYRIKAYNKFGSSNWSEKTETSAGPLTGTVFIYPTADAHISSGSPTLNMGQSINMKVSKYSDGGREEIYIRFPYEEIPKYAIVIDSAQLCLISPKRIGALFPLVYVEDLAISWNESSVIWNNRPFGRGIGEDNAYVYNNGQPVYWNITPIVKSWFQGITLNHGIKLYAFTEGLGILKSRESTQKPSLTVEYIW